MLTDFPFILVTYPDHPAKTVADVIKSAQADPGKLTYATAGNGTGMHLASELLLSIGRRSRFSMCPIAARRRRSPT